MIECYETILCFSNFPLFKKKEKNDKFRGPFEQEAAGAPPLKSASGLIIDTLAKIFKL